MEGELSVPKADGGRKSGAQIVSEDLSKITSGPSLLQNAGVLHQPSLSRESNLAAELEREKRKIVELQDLLNVQRHRVDTMATKAKETEEKQAVLLSKIESLLTFMYQ